MFNCWVRSVEWLIFNNNVYKQLQSLLVLSFLLCSQQSNHQLLISHQPHSAFFLSDARVTVESLLTDEKERQKYEDQSRESSFSTFTSMTESCLFKDLKRNTCLYEHTQAVSVCVCVCVHEAGQSETEDIIWIWGPDSALSVFTYYQSLSFMSRQQLNWLFLVFLKRYTYYFLWINH